MILILSDILAISSIELVRYIKKLGGEYLLLTAEDFFSELRLEFTSKGPFFYLKNKTIDLNQINVVWYWRWNYNLFINNGTDNNEEYFINNINEINNYVKLDVRELSEFFFDNIKAKWINTIKAKDISKLEQLKIAKEYRTFEEIILFVLSLDKSLNEENISSFIIDLIESNILVSNIDLSIMSKKPINDIINKLSPESDYTNKLKGIQDILNFTSNSIINNTSILFEKLEDIGIKLKHNEIIYNADSVLKDEKDEHIKIDTNILSDLTIVKEYLKHLSNENNKNLNNFIKDYIRIYGEKEMPLINVLDPSNGIGYIQKNENIGDLIEAKGLSIPFKSVKNVTLSENELIILKKVINNIDKPNFDIRDFNIKTSKKEIKESKSSLVSIKILDNFEQVVLNEFIEISASKFLSKYATNHNELYDELIKINAFEKEQSDKENSIIVEFVHLPEIRMANLLKHEHLKDVQLSCVFPSDTHKNICLKDVFIKIKNKKIILFSKKLNKQIIPSFSNTINPLFSPINIYNFLFDPQGQDNYHSLYFDWGNLSNILYDFPRIVYKNIIISPHMWKLEIHDIDINADVEIALNNRSIPNSFYISDSLSSDEKLFINIKNKLSKEIFILEMKSKKKLILIESFEDLNTFVKDDKQETYNHELLIPLVNNNYKTKKSSIISINNDIQHKFFPGSEWLYLKIYCTNHVAEKIVRNYFNLIINYLINKKLIKRWFFIRFYDESYHLRLRFNIKDTNIGEVYSIVTSYLLPEIKTNNIFKIVIDTYDREIERYNNKLISLSEDIFHIDSLMVTEYLSKEINKNLEFAILGIDNYLEQFNYKLIDKMEIINLLSLHSLNEYNTNKDLRKQLNKKYKELSPLIDKLFYNNTENTEIKTLIDSYDFKTTSKLILEEVISKNNKNEIVSDYIHMFLNRLFLSNPRYNEMFVYYLMHKHYSRFYILETKNKKY